jgi:predicted glycogen debranching enzyme
METLLSREWLISNTLGSYASSTVLNCNTRRYHGMLISANIPPLGRVLTVNNFLERLIIDGREYQMSNFEFNGAVHPKGFDYQTSFHRQIDEDLSSVTFVYEVDGVTFMRTLWLMADHNTALINWLAVDSRGMRSIQIAVHPLVSMRDFHSLRRQSASNLFHPQQVGNALHLDVPPFGPTQENDFYGINLIPTGLRGPVNAEFHPGEDWWYNFRYRVEAQRGQDCGEDLYLPGFFDLSGQGKVSFGLWLDTEGLNEKELDKQLTKINYHLQAGQGPLTIIDEMSSNLAPSVESSSDNPLNEPVEVTLRKAAGQFVVQRKDLNGKNRWTILAGFPWFGDWGRDAFIALPGLLLSTGRYEQAKEVLQLFGSAESEGLIPNRFDDYGGEPHYNTVDASLWYIVAADEYLRTSGDTESWKKIFQKVCLNIVENYMKGTQFNIHMDSADGLLWAGSEETQLTWMDARCNNVTFTPRWGKPVEINALWYNALKIVAERLEDSKQKKAEELTELAEKVKASFQKKFWNAEGNYLYDCVREDFQDTAIRPNQIFAVSLRNSPLERHQQKAVVECVKNHLLTPVGLRSLSPTDPNYRGVYAGDGFTRDSAYHQGTAWGFLMGPFIEAYLRVNNNPDSAEVAKDFLKPMLNNLYESGIGSINEIFDGDAPHTPRGCFAQAWSVAQAIQAHLAIKQCLAGKNVEERITLGK